MKNIKGMKMVSLIIFDNLLKARSYQLSWGIYSWTRFLLYVSYCLN